MELNKITEKIIGCAIEVHKVQRNTYGVLPWDSCAST